MPLGSSSAAPVMRPGPRALHTLRRLDLSAAIVPRLACRSVRDYISAFGGNGECAMSILGWAIFGLITGFIASKIVRGRGQGCILNMVLGIVGALVGGAIFRGISDFDVFHFNLESM